MYHIFSPYLVKFICNPPQSSSIFHTAVVPTSGTIQALAHLIAILAGIKLLHNSKACFDKPMWISQSVIKISLSFIPIGLSKQAELLGNTIIIIIITIKSHKALKAP